MSKFRLTDPLRAAVAAVELSPTSKRMLDVIASDFEPPPEGVIESLGDLQVFLMDSRESFAARFGLLFIAATHLGGASPEARWGRLFELIHEAHTVEQCAPVMATLWTAMEGFEESADANGEWPDGVGPTVAIVCALAGYLSSHMTRLEIDSILQ